MRAVTTSLNRQTGSFRVQALLIQSGKRKVVVRELQRAVLGNMAFIGKEILVRFKSPLISFFPICLITYFPICLILLTCVLSPQFLPPLLFALGCLSSGTCGPGLKFSTKRKIQSLLGEMKSLQSESSEVMSQFSLTFSIGRASGSNSSTVLGTSFFPHNQFIYQQC